MDDDVGDRPPVERIFQCREARRRTLASSLVVMVETGTYDEIPLLRFPTVQVPGTECRLLLDAETANLAAHALAIAMREEVRGVAVHPGGVTCRLGLVADFTLHLRDVRLRNGFGSVSPVTSSIPPILPDGEHVLIPHLLTIDVDGEERDGTVWEVMTRGELAGWLDAPVPNLAFVEKHLDELLRLRSEVREGSLPDEEPYRELRRLLDRRLHVNEVRPSSSRPLPRSAQDPSRVRLPLPKELKALPSAPWHFLDLDNKRRGKQDPQLSPLGECASFPERHPVVLDACSNRSQVVHDEGEMG